VTSLRAAMVAARDRLQSAGIDQAQIEAEILLRYALESVASSDGGAPAPPASASGRAVSRVQLYTRFEEEMAPGVEAAFASFLTRRLAHEPSAYITGRKQFCGLEFMVTPAVLIPRPETEGLVEAVVSEVRGRIGRLRIADVGTGSGAIAVALAKALPQAEVYASDVSREALAVAAENARRHGVERRIELRCGQLLTPVHDYVDCIVANLPYVTTADWSRLEPELREHEPRLALDGGEDGLDLIRALLLQAPRYLPPEGCVALEMGEGQAGALARFVEASMPGAVWRVERDLAGKDRVFILKPGG
jgi:release factor glutamine methyltransferase